MNSNGLKGKHKREPVHIDGDAGTNPARKHASTHTNTDPYITPKSQEGECTNLGNGLVTNQAHAPHLPFTRLINRTEKRRSIEHEPNQQVGKM
jgi:hypothetical protein